MKITFKISESFEQIIYQITHDYPTVWESIKKENGEIFLYDENYDSYAICNIWPENLGITINTAFSNFQYDITPNPDGCEVVYIGAYRGLLEQFLIPTMTPEFEGVELVESSLELSIQLEKYIDLQDDFAIFRKKHKALHTHVHPKCIVNYLSKKFQDELTD